MVTQKHKLKDQDLRCMNDLTFGRPKVTNGYSEAQARRPGPSGKGIAFWNEGDGRSLVDGTFRAVTPGAPRRKQRPSLGAGVRVKREYVRRLGLYT